MQTIQVIIRRLSYFRCLLFFVVLLSGCGGGGGGGDDDAPATPLQVQLSGDASAEVGESVGVVARFSGGGGDFGSPQKFTDFAHFSWQQLEGSPVVLVGNGSAAISFDAPTSGNYRFQFSAHSADGETMSETFTIAVTEPSGGPKVQLRADRAVSEGAVFSLRLNTDSRFADNTPLTVSFRQLSGPEAAFDQSVSDAGLIFVGVPWVEADQVLVFEAQLQAGEETFTDQVFVVVQDRPQITSEFFCVGRGGSCSTTSPLANVYSYKRTSPYRNSLAGCVYSNQLTEANLCTLGQLPPIGLNNNTPSVGQIMDRVLVSHDWMGERFERYLRDLDHSGDFARLLRATTAVVISHDLRPSFYWSLTGAIYLDPDSLWLEPAERDLINEQADYRRNFGAELQFVMPRRYVKNNEYAFENIPPLVRESRSLAAVEADLGSLLYHELAHANDFMPQSKLNSGLDTGSIFFNAAQQGTPVSNIVRNINSHNSREMRGLAGIRFLGFRASPAQKSYTPDDVASFFFPDSANDFYSYSTQFEDLAMLFEETMMSLRYGIDRDVAATSFPRNPQSGNDYIVSQGQRNRVGAQGIHLRATAAVQHLLPEAWGQAEDHLRSLVPIPLCAGEGWADNLTPACADTVLSARSSARIPIQRPRTFEPPTRR